MRSYRCVISSLVVIVEAIFLTLGVSTSAKESAVCPDMSEHQQTLDAGERYYQEHGGGTTSHGNAFDCLDVWPGKAYVPEPSEPRSDFRSTSDRALQLQILEATYTPLKTITEIQSAELLASELEAAAKYDIAKKLLEKILLARMNIAPKNEACVARIRTDIRRVATLQSAGEYVKRGQISGALSLYRQAITYIVSAKTIDLYDKLAFLTPISHDLDKIAAKGSKGTRELLERTRDLCTVYRRSLDCIQMAEELDRSGWRLEKSGFTHMAEKAFKESLDIKRKNLGLNDPDTLAAYGDLARLSADRGQFTAAESIYEEALSQYRKLSDPGAPYANMLEAYGDMLNRRHQTAKAEKIYAEARRFYQRQRENSSGH
jgi:tetratricopeptide (TPR) repeat protein